MKMLCPRHVIVSIITFTLLVVGHKIASAQCSCFAQLKIRNVNIGVVPTGYNHAFWWFEVDPGNVYVVDAGPSGICPACGLLIDWIVPGNTGHYSQDNQYATSGFMATPSVTLCTQTESMLNYAIDWATGTQPAYVLAGSPNSNTFAHNLGNSGGFTTLTAPPNAIGW